MKRGKGSPNYGKGRITRSNGYVAVWLMTDAQLRSLVNDFTEDDPPPYGAAA